MNKTIKTIVFLSLTALIIACKGDEKKPEQNTTTTTETETLESENSAFAIAIESNDQMQFNVKELKVTVGEPVVLTLKNVGKMAKRCYGT